MHKCIKYSDNGMGIHIVKDQMIIYGFDDICIDSIKINHCPFCGICFQPDSSKREDASKPMTDEDYVVKLLSDPLNASFCWVNGDAVLGTRQ